MNSGVYPPEGPQTIGQVLDSGFRIFKVSLVRCLLFGALAMIAGQLPNIYSLMVGKTPAVFSTRDPITLALAVAGSVLTIYLSGVMLIRQREIAKGHRESTRVELARGLRRLPALLVVALISLLAVALVPGAGMLLAGSSLPEPLYIAALAVLSVSGGAVLWLIPGFAMAVAIAVLGEAGPIASLRQGVALATGSWWRTMLTFVVWGILLAVFNLIVVVLILMTLPILGATDIATLSAGTPVVLVALRAVGLPFMVAILLAVYADLLVRKQGVDLQRRVAGMVQA
jgi:hypothetical protein